MNVFSVRIFPSVLLLGQGFHLSVGSERQQLCLSVTVCLPGECIRYLDIPQSVRARISSFCGF